MPVEVRQRFARAVKEKDEKTKWEILSMALSALFAKSDKRVHIAGESGTIN